jgi:L-alanine-DL-glutamate epimerase-like enolase superfamily enzyme
MSLPILASLDNASFLEVMPWFEPAYQDRVRIEDGVAHVSDLPGHGCRLDIAALERMRF